MADIQWIDSKVFYHIHENSEVDCYGSISVYSHLLKARDGYHYIAPENNLKGYKLLHKRTGISVTALKKYVPDLIYLDLCHFTEDGGFFMVGRKTLAFRFSNKYNKKVPIQLFKKITDTKYSAKAVIICSHLQNQQKAIDNKGTLIKGIRLLEREDGKVSRKIRDKIDRAIEQGFGFKNPNWCKNTVLSNRGFGSKIENKGVSTPTATKQRGKRLKNKLESLGKIMTRRRFRPIHNQYYTYKQYLQVKAQIIDSYNNLTYHNGRICEEIVPEVAWIDIDFRYSEEGEILMPWSSRFIKEKVAALDKDSTKTTSSLNVW